MTTREIGLFNIGDKIEIYKKDSISRETFPSQILDILGEDEFIISGPIKKRMLVFLHKDEVVTITAIVEDSGRYEFDAKVLKRYLGKLYKIKLKKISEAKKVQQRDFFRFETSIPVTKRSTVIEDGEEKTIVEDCKTKDISGGGLKLLTNYAHHVGETIECEFQIEENLIVTKAKIIRLEPVDTFDYKFSLGVQFLGISESHIDTIVKFIFLNQRTLREKGLI